MIVLLDLLGRRWAFRILFELDSQGPLTFGELLERCHPISPGVLSQRLRELTENRIVEQHAKGYGLTRVARGLRDPMTDLHDWSKRWAQVMRRRAASEPKKRASTRR